MEPTLTFTRTETKLAELLWTDGPMETAELVRLAEQEYTWKKPTTLANLKSLVEKGLAENEHSQVSMLYTREEIVAEQSYRYIDEAFGGSLPMFFASYITGRVIPPDQIDLLKRLLIKHERDNAPEEEDAPDPEAS